MARPTIYSEELAEKICERIAEGESVRSIALDGEMPNASTIHRWVIQDEQGFCKQYEEAKQIGLEVRAEELEKIAETMEDLQRAKLVVDTKKWNMSKIAPKRFGDKSTLVSEDEDGKQVPITGIVINTPNANEGTGDKSES